jgi:DNA-binding MurR/RpiR family transcriptional regulator
MDDVINGISHMAYLRQGGAARRRIVTQLIGMKGAALRVAQLLMDSSVSIQELSIAEIAERCETSPASLLRISRNVGYRNFSELRAALQEGENAVVDPWVKERTGLFFTSLLDTCDTLDTEGIAEAAEMICAAKNVMIFGALLSAPIAQMLELRLRTMKMFTSFTSDSEVAVNSLFSSDQLLFCVSHMGASPPVIRVLSHAGRLGIPIVLLTNLSNAPGTRYANVTLTTNVTSMPNVGEDVFCRVSGLLVVDLLLVKIAQILTAQET